MKKNNNKNLAFIALAVLALLGALFAFPKSQTRLRGEDFLSLYRSTESAVLLDVRTPAEYASGHIEGAINIDFENANFVEEIKKLDTSKTYFVYCRSGNRSGQAVARMNASGITKVFDLQGGVTGNKASVKLVTSQNTTDEYLVDPSDMLKETSTVTGSFIKLSSNERLGLIQMREEEKLARDVYRTLGDTWGMKIFSNIASSEQTHTNAVKGLLVAYGIEDPVKDDTVGVFTSPEMQNLYNTLVAQGKKSLQEALIVGATVEDLDIYDLEILKKETTQKDILSVYNNLQKGSRNHMRAFVKNLESRGATYEPKYINKESFNAIISGTQERGLY